RVFDMNVSAAGGTLEVDRRSLFGSSHLSARRRVLHVVEAIQVVAVHKPDQFAGVARIGRIARPIQLARKLFRIRPGGHRTRVATVFHEERAMENSRYAGAMATRAEPKQFARELN